MLFAFITIDIHVLLFIRLDNDNQTLSNVNVNVKQMEYELIDARYQIEKLQKQIENNSNKDDRASLESQVNFLNSVIVELRHANERLSKELEFQRNPFLAEDQHNGENNIRVHSSVPRLYCKLNFSMIFSSTSMNH
jgi:SMC interacting uncharacterized protein involved in chromosome segregation